MTDYNKPELTRLARIVADNPEQSTVTRLELSLGAARAASDGTAFSKVVGINQFIRLAPTPAAGDVTISLDAGASARKMASPIYLTPGATVFKPFKKLTIENAAQAGKTAVIEMSPDTPLPQVYEPTGTIAKTQDVNQVSNGNINPADVIRGWIDRYARVAPAGALVIERFSAANQNKVLPPNQFSNFDITISPPARNIAEGNVRVFCGGVLAVGGDVGDSDHVALMGARVRALSYEVDDAANTYQTPVPIDGISVVGVGRDVGGDQNYPNPEILFNVAPFVLRRPSGNRNCAVRFNIVGALINTSGGNVNYAARAAYCFDAIDVPVAASPFGA